MLLLVKGTIANRLKNQIIDSNVLSRTAASTIQLALDSRAENTPYTIANRLKNQIENSNVLSQTAASQTLRYFEVQRTAAPNCEAKNTGPRQ